MLKDKTQMDVNKYQEQELNEFASEHAKIFEGTSNDGAIELFVEEFNNLMSEFAKENNVNQTTGLQEYAQLKEDQIKELFMIGGNCFYYNSADNGLTGKGCTKLAGCGACDVVCKECGVCSNIDKCAGCNRTCCVFTWVCSLWTGIGLLAMPFSHIFMYGGNKACDGGALPCNGGDLFEFCEPKDWYQEFGETGADEATNWGEDNAIQVGYDNALAGWEDKKVNVERLDFSDNSLDNPLTLRDIGENNKQFAFRLTTKLDGTAEFNDQTDMSKRIPVIVAGGRGSDVSNLWDMREGKVLDVSDFPDNHKYAFYSMDYPRYSNSNPQTDGVLLPGYEEHILTDYKALFDYVEQQGHTKKPLLAGVSMGTGVVQGLAKDIMDDIPKGTMLNDKIAGMMLVNPFKTGKQASLDMFGGVQKAWQWPFLEGASINDWDSATKMELLQQNGGEDGDGVPTFIYSSIDDKFIDSQQHRDLFEIASGATVEESEDLSGAAFTSGNKLLVQGHKGHYYVDLHGSDVEGGPPVEALHGQGSKIKTWLDTYVDP